MNVFQAIINSAASLGSSLTQDNPALTADGGQDFAAVLDQAMGRFSEGGRTVLASVLNNKGLTTTSSQDNPFTFMKGYQSASEVAEALDLTRAGLPASYKKQIGLGLLAMGRQGSSPDSMQSGASLMDCRSSGDALKGLFSSLGAERPFLKLGKEALPALGQILSDSGLDDERLNAVMSELAAGSLTLDQVFHKLEKLDLSGSGYGRGLTATEDGLQALGQFFGSLGASAEIVAAVTSSFKPGEKITASALRQIIGSGDDGFLAPTLSEADVDNLANMLRSMGAGQKSLNSLANLLSQSQGRMSVNSFMDFIEGMENAPLKQAGSQELALIKTIMANISREQELAKTPVFNETLAKLQALGDQEIDDEFVRLSPALQALKGGITASQIAAPNGQPGQNGQNGRHNDRDSRENYRQALATAAAGETTPAAAQETVATMQSYGGQESLARQISQKLLYSHRRGIHRLKMNLNPADLGQLDIELKVSGDQLVAHIRTKNREAFEALSGEIEALKDSLADSGLNINNLTLAYDDAQTGQSEFADLRASRSDREISRRAAEAAARQSAHQGELSRMI